MDHSMHHAGMDHGHGDMDMGDKCNMNMLFTFSSENLCIIFRQWRVTGTFSLLVSLIVIVLLTAGYEGVRELTRRVEMARAPAIKDSVTDRHDNETADAPDNPLPNTYSDHIVQDETSSLLFVARHGGRQQKGKVVLATLYAAQVFYSFFIMLLFMTYNFWVMLAVAVGAFVGYMVFGGSTATKSVSCH